jgi:transposase
MRPKGTPAELEHRRQLAVQRVFEGYSTQEVAEFLGVDPSSVRRWVAAFRDRGAAGLAAQAVPGRPPKLTRTQEKVLLRWVLDSPTEHGFMTELWTGRRLAAVIEQEWSVRLNPRYLAAWLRTRGYSPQKPQRVPRQRDPEEIARWLKDEWPRIKKRRAVKVRELL